MTVLILNRGPLTKRRYDEWLADHPGPLLLLTSRQSLATYGDVLPEAGYAHAEAVDFEVPGEVEERVLDLARTHRIEYLVATQESDLQRAGALRDRLGLPGQSEQSAIAFRNKLVMKRLARRAGIAVAEHAPVEHAQDVRDFAEQHGFPLVLKVRDGSSSVGQHILHSAAELDAHLAAAGEIEPGRLMVEAFVAGSMVHIDGMVLDGRVAAAWPSRYLYQLGSFADHREPRRDVALDRDDPLTGRLLAFLDQLLAALPTPADTTFHAEVFHTPDDRLVLCEIASRNGGALIKGVLHALFDVDFPLAWIRACAGLPVPVPRGADPLVPRQLAGQLLILKRPGTVRTLPEKAPFDWVTLYETYAEPGQRIAAAASSGDFLAAMVVSGPDRTAVEQRLAEAARWFEDELDLDPTPAEEAHA
ncbi:NikS protein [Kitasatospora sp. NPDC059571]|uniref:NikS protein n=1 Tax=Kitasatospora sp. NPDC059571 TaxID=3346871 RepID=UPI0036CCC5D6